MSALPSGLQCEQGGEATGLGHCDCVGCAVARALAPPGGGASSGCGCGGNCGAAASLGGSVEAAAARTGPAAASAARKRKSGDEPPRGQTCDCSFGNPDGSRCGDRGTVVDSQGWFYDTTSKNCEAEATCTHPCSNCYVAGGSKDLVAKLTDKELRAMCGEKGFDEACGGVDCKYNSATERCECTLKCCDSGYEKGSECKGCSKVPFEGDFAPCPERERDSKATIVSASPCRDKSLNMTEYADSTNVASLAGPPWAAVSSGAGAFNPGGGTAVAGCCEAYECDMTITARAFPRHTSAPKYYAGVESMIEWGGNYMVAANSEGKHNAMVQKDEVVDALAWAWAVVNDSQDIIESVVCRFYGKEVAAEVSKAIDWFYVDMLVQSLDEKLVASFRAPNGRVVLSVRATGGDPPADLFECLVAKISSEANVASDSTECALISLVSSVLHEMLHVIVGGASEHLAAPCWARSENCDPLIAMDCRLMETLSQAYGAVLCAAPCAATAEDTTGVVGACPPCHWSNQWGQDLFGEYGYHVPITTVAGCYT